MGPGAQLVFRDSLSWPVGPVVNVCFDVCFESGLPCDGKQTVDSHWIVQASM
jgi:hypothetical protein